MLFGPRRSGLALLGWTTVRESYSRALEQGSLVGGTDVVFYGSMAKNESMEFGAIFAAQWRRIIRASWSTIAIHFHSQGGYSFLLCGKCDPAAFVTSALRLDSRRPSKHFRTYFWLNVNERHSLQLFVVEFDTCLVWELLLLPSNAQTAPNLPSLKGAR